MIDRAGHARLGVIDEPMLAPDQVLLRIRTVGFCGSDLSTYRGLNPLVSYPRVPGHEIGGTIVALGADVPDGPLREGLDVTVVPYTACGFCAACRRGRSNACENNQTLGVQRDGALTELLAVPWRMVIPADGLSLRELAIVEPLSVGFHAVDRGRVRGEDTVVVIGCGAVGLGAIAGARERGARTIAVDIDEQKLELAKKAGATTGIDMRAGPLDAQLKSLTDGLGPDVVIEAVGIPDTFVGAVTAVAFTGRVVYIGYAKAPVSYDTSQFVKKELDIMGSRNATTSDFRAVVAMLQRKVFPVDETVTRSVSLDAAAEALHTWHEAPSSVTRVHVEIA